MQSVLVITRAETQSERPGAADGDDQSAVQQQIGEEIEPVTSDPRTPLHDHPRGGIIADVPGMSFPE